MGHSSGSALFENAHISLSGAVLVSRLTSRRMQSAIRASPHRFAVCRARKGLPPRNFQAHRTVHFHGVPLDPNELHGLCFSYFKTKA